MLFRTIAGLSKDVLEACEKLVHVLLLSVLNGTVLQSGQGCTRFVNFPCSALLRILAVCVEMRCTVSYFLGTVPAPPFLGSTFYVQRKL